MIQRPLKPREDAREKKAHGFLNDYNLHQVKRVNPSEKPIGNRDTADRMDRVRINSAMDEMVARIEGRLKQKRQMEEAPEAVGWQRDWKVELPDVLTFCDKWLGEKLWPGPQQELALSIFGTDPFQWRGGSMIQEAYAKWGKGSGKDRTLSKLFDYACAKLVNLWNPWGYFQKPEGDPIDIINVSFNATQARNVFFKHLKAMMRKTRNPSTGRNFFEEMGLDLREGGKSLQARKVILNDQKTTTGEDTICCHAGDSKVITGEGMAILMALFDELGAFPSVRKAMDLHDALLDTAVSRFKDNALIAGISYIYARNDAMETIYERAKKAEKDGRAFLSTRPTWEVNPTVTRETFANAYKKNPQRAMRVFECKTVDAENQFFKPSEEVRGQANTEREWPIEGNEWRDVVSLQGLQFKDWFVGVPAVQYHLRFDLATGKEGRDKVGLALCHKIRRRPAYSQAYLDALKASGHEAQVGDDMPREGVFIDFMAQVSAVPGGEVPFQSLIDFALWLRDERKFDISLITYDGWQSRGEQQRLKDKGFKVEELSVDKDNLAAETTKELIYAGLLDYYTFPVFLREAEELVYDDKGKVDHPELSKLREREEEDSRGSKDVWDGVAGNVATLITDEGDGGSTGGLDPWFAP